MPKVRGKGAEAKRHNVSLRVTPTIMGRLDAAIAENGRSLAQELEDRIVRSFEFDDALDRTNLKFFYALKSRLDQLHAVMGKGHWTTDFAAWHAVREILPAVLKDFRPSPPNAVKILAAARKEEAARQAYHEEQSKFWARAEIQGLTSAANALQRAMPAETFHPQNSPVFAKLGDEDRAAILKQHRKFLDVSKVWEEAKADLELAWARSDKLQSEGSKMAADILRLDDRPLSISNPE